jgi:hypothetical protein
MNKKSLHIPMGEEEDSIPPFLIKLLGQLLPNINPLQALTVSTQQLTQSLSEMLYLDQSHISEISEIISSSSEEFFPSEKGISLNQTNCHMRIEKIFEIF